MVGVFLILFVVVGVNFGWCIVLVCCMVVGN